MTVSVLLICSGEILTCNFSYTRRMVLREGSENSVAGGGNAAGRRNAKDAALPGMAGPVVGRAATAEDGRAVPCPGWVEAWLRVYTLKQAWLHRQLATHFKSRWETTTVVDTAAIMESADLAQFFTTE
jgi:hypothetical protein